MTVIALLMAAGSGQRFGAAQPKQYLPLLGRAVLRHAAEALLAEGRVTAIQPVCARGEEGRIAALLEGLPSLPPVTGGATRQESVRAGLEALARRAPPPEAVLVHDAARPVVPSGTIPALLAALDTHPGAIPAQPVADTLKRAEGGLIAVTVPRAGLYRAQTPQAFRFAPLLAAHRAAAEEATDDAQLLERAGATVALVPGAETNVKITFPEDLARVEAMLMTRLMPRIGTGFDVHRTEKGRRMVLCGVEVPCEFGLEGHSDADVGIHALCDAIYGALAEGDIGRWFPPSEMTWKDADSAQFLRHAAGRIAARGGVLANADVTLLCERPRIGPHRDAMQARLAELLGVAPGLVSVKATTTERLGFTGRGEGIAAQAAAMLLLPMG
ncbi:bifunctional 2-C-methyl-D-erythritol 4-phosphate cytidylyltransferase/2-C-methyl-D-erythritol 2,4-cyclodiphosphate synthase [Siccirubricoccus sp. KC 17139]|uniref:Bifunctional enzyme IspD/IspF n=1 Tax=Siccirubricoccus soli TaxID=2899147 RepID=A0ABT1D4U7_9PROT|nr:bifunctional 2-C-methyl-D-erythritol 4-phosphate cytidylyltransferase/2-C-methyl-D-erythritol 2,4-cyclodiphosphate synthase [Siccirubricoccus soli]MCO6416234.1 bifunctional 2-C-methyl-D-erythritol 4-phosphate cytidylyltransferase/2-C-methyl-D-erythritol 2,4-cyclodiphosphate synthase [Siccirubricoccus soli]MCP2682368.1 bifunctional 2-C-methyl-D-erythritol 4-phosphate cytidylyltransferase/2-C-methyl-D-erythritol 2,4-cyclodiphosphate synthase [Siccirubricoccus soli]